MRPRSGVRRRPVCTLAWSIESCAWRADGCSYRSQIQSVAYMTLRAKLIAQIWHGVDPLENLKQTRPPDFQGWNSGHPYLFDAIHHHRPGLVVEIGVWKGASVLTLARGLHALDCDGVVIAVDTWLGSSEHWPADPRLYEQFLSNIAVEKMQDYVIPMRLDSASACHVLDGHMVRPVVVHLDAGHDYLSVITDLTRWWSLLQPGGTMIVDDYDLPVWPEVVRAVDEFRAQMPHLGFEAAAKKCRLVKPQY
jgi:hypothetical protein